jgi:hypothetical protein
VIVGKQKRSPDLFQKLLELPSESKQLTLPRLKNACHVGYSLFTHFTQSVWNITSPQNTLIIASEDLDLHPEETWSRIANAIGLSTMHPKLIEFSKVKYNSNNAKGEHNIKQKSQLKPGLYAASNYTQMHNKSRVMLNTCWQNDCIFTSIVTGHNYTICANSLNSNNKQYNEIMTYIQTSGYQFYNQNNNNTTKRVPFFSHNNHTMQFIMLNNL